MGEKGLRVSYGKYVYEHVPGWGSLPDGWEWNHAVGVAVDGQDRIFVYNRSDAPDNRAGHGGQRDRSLGRGAVRLGAPHRGGA